MGERKMKVRKRTRLAIFVSYYLSLESKAGMKASL